MHEDDGFGHKDVNFFLNTTQLPSLKICGLHIKPHGVIGLSKYYHILFDPKLVHFICAIFQIPCVFVESSYILDKPRVRFFSPHQQLIYQPVKYFTYWSVLGSSNKCTIIILSPKSTTSGGF